MNFEEEISLLIKSRYPLVLVDTIDENYVLGQLFGVAQSQAVVVVVPLFVDADAKPDFGWMDSATEAPAHHGQPKVGRNDPCPCGSGRKFKKCCGQ